MQLSLFSDSGCIDSMIFCVGDKQNFSELLKAHKNINVSAVENLASKYGFAGEYEKVLTLNLLVGDSVTSIVLVGLGGKPYMEAFYAHRIGIVVFEQMQRLKMSNPCVSINIEELIEEDSKAKDYLQSMLCGLGSADFSLGSKYKATVLDAPAPHVVERVYLSLSSDVFQDSDIESINILADSVKLAKDLCGTPSNLKTPEIISKKIIDDLSGLGVRVTVFGEDELYKMGMHAMLSVGQGSTNESKMVVMYWQGDSSAEDSLALVGKGVTFDSGGISIKPAKDMEDMRFDMSGSAAVVATIRNLAARKATINVVGIVGFVENMPSGNAVKPGDVVRTMSGKSIEVINTDAEGRVLLADLLWYAQLNFKVNVVIDLATLTGAITVALGDGVYGGLFSNDDGLATKLLECGQSSGERMWRMPLAMEYDKAINSDIADVRNTSTIKGAGSSTAAHFLMRFIKDDISWAHLDIAGVAYRSAGLPAAHCRSVGFGVRILDSFIRTLE